MPVVIGAVVAWKSARAKLQEAIDAAEAEALNPSAVANLELAVTKAQDAIKDAAQGSINLMVQWND